VNFVVTHLPHLLPAAFGLAFLVKFGVYAMRLPPAHLSDEELADWRRAQAAQRRPPRRVSRVVARLGTAALPWLVVGFGTGLLMYTFALRDDRPSPELVWTHVVTSAIGLALVTWKIVRVPRRGLRRGLEPRHLLHEGSSLVLAAVSLPLAVTGVVLLAAPSDDSFTAYLHLVTGVWWTIVLQWHLYRYLSRALKTTFRPARQPAPRPAGEPR
jgi:uncharacterized membrane protein